MSAERPTQVWEPQTEFPGSQIVRGLTCEIWLSVRAGWCDRGRFIAHLEAWGELARSLDWADGWPRYYFDETRAKLEIEAWLAARNQILKPGEPQPARFGPAA